MIIAKVNGQVHRIYMVDGHSHIGHDIDEVSNPNPMAAFGTFDFYKKTYQEVIKVTGGDEWSFKSRGNTYEFKIIPNPPVYAIFKQASQISEQYSKMMEKLENSWMFDFGIGFPFQDKYRDTDPTALFRTSNERVASVVTKFPVSLKMSGYCRVHPDEGQRAVEEVTHSITVKGLRGLKLHPRSEGWLDHINNPNGVNVLVEAARLSLPVIFDTRGKESIYAIHDLVKATRSHLERTAPALVPHLKVQIGHCAAGNMDDARTYQAISDPNMYGELSMVRSPEFDHFIVDFMKKSPAGKDWSKHIIFGSDFPYFFERHAKDIISCLLTQPFYDQGGTIEDTKNILGMSLMRLMPEYNVPPKQVVSFPNPVAVHARDNNGTKALDLVSQVIVKLIEDSSVDITKFVPMFKDNFNTYKNEYLMGLRWGVNGEQKDLLFMCINLIGGDLYGFGPIGENGTWNKLGYSYFSPDGMVALDALSNINTFATPEEGWSTLKGLFTEPKVAQKKLLPQRAPVKPTGMKHAGMKPVKPSKPAA